MRPWILISTSPDYIRFYCFHPWVIFFERFAFHWIFNAPVDHIAKQSDLLVLDLNSKTAVSDSSQKQPMKSQMPAEKTADEYKISESEFVGLHPEFLFVVKDLIVNPAGTGGMRYLLTSVGIEVTNEKAFAEIQSKEIIVNDILINILSNKTLEELSDVSKRKDLRREIARKVDDILTQGKVRNVYFSKFIIQ